MGEGATIFDGNRGRIFMDYNWILCLLGIFFKVLNVLLFWILDIYSLCTKCKRTCFKILYHSNLGASMLFV